MLCLTIDYNKHIYNPIIFKIYNKICNNFFIFVVYMFFGFLIFDLIFKVIKWM